MHWHRHALKVKIRVTCNQTCTHWSHYFPTSLWVYICSKGYVEGGFMSQRPEGIALFSIPHHCIDSNRCTSQQTCNYHPENVVFLTETTAERRGGKSEWEGEKRGLDWEKVRGKEEEEDTFKSPKKENCKLQVLVVCRGLILWQRINWEAYGFNTDWVGLHEVLRDDVCSVSQTPTLRIHVCPHCCISTWDCNLHQPCNGSLNSPTVQSEGIGGFKAAAPLRLRVFDMAQVMFTCLATRVTKTAIRNHACLVGVETLVLYLNQAKDKRSIV